MLFSSIIFIFYFLPVVLGLYYLFSFSRTGQNILLLVFSLLFYAWGEGEHLVILLSSILMNALFALLADRLRKKRLWGRLILVAMLAFNLGILFYYKYLNFTLQNLNSLFGTSFTVSDTVLPLGISFFTFQAISYVIDVYRQTVPLQKNPFYVGLYISFFPQLIAGPIVRYDTIADQIQNRRHTLRKFSVGCCRFITGLSKKVLIANNMAVVADHIYALTASDPVSVSLAWLGSIAYTLQIYFDFSAYSDMAIGLGLAFGFQFDENFNYPYISRSVSEFWRRWHISLTTWFKSYVYFPLGGSRVENKDKMVRNMFIVWLLTGIWHGAQWTFILWGLLNFLVILTERFLRLDTMSGHVALRRTATLLLVNFGWVLFRAVDLTQAWQYLRNMLGLSGSPLLCAQTAVFLREYGVFFVLGAVFSVPVAKRFNRLLADGATGKLSPLLAACYPVVLLSLFFLCVSFLVKGSYNPFIYFNF